MTSEQTIMIMMRKMDIHRRMFVLALSARRLDRHTAPCCEHSWYAIPSTSCHASDE